MDASFSENLLLALVECVRDTCKKQIKFDDFAVVSGFLCIDVDGRTQHQFVLSERLQKHGYTGDGQSACVQVSDWHRLRQTLNNYQVKRNTNLRKTHKASSPKTLIHRDKNDRNDKAKTFTRNQAYERRQTFTRENLTSPARDFSYLASRNKTSNRTFIIGDFHSSKQNEGSMTCSEHNVSPSMDIFKKNASPTHHKSIQRHRQSSCKFKSRGKSPSPENETSTGNLARYPSSYMPLPESSYSAPKLNDSQVVMPKSPYHEYGGNDVAAKDNSFKDIRNSGLTGHCIDEHICQHIKYPTNYLSPEAHAKASRQMVEIKSQSCDQKMLESEERYYDGGQASGFDSERSSRQSPSSKLPGSSESSDVSIGSTRPLYLVQHNGELLLPCPNLSAKHHATKEKLLNNNKNKDICKSDFTCEENNLVTDPTDISSLIGTLIGALSKTSQKAKNNGLHDSFVVSRDKQPHKAKDKDNISATSNTTLNTVSSLELDTDCTFQQKDVGNNQEEVTTESRLPDRSLETECQQLISDSSSVIKKKSKMFKWMKLFKRDLNQTSRSEHLRSQPSSLTSLRSLTTTRSMDMETSRNVRRQEENKGKK